VTTAERRQDGGVVLGHAWRRRWGRRRTEEEEEM
jgi:hypothetical protein